MQMSMARGWGWIDEPDRFICFTRFHSTEHVYRMYSRLIAGINSGERDPIAPELRMDKEHKYALTLFISQIRRRLLPNLIEEFGDRPVASVHLGSDMR